MTWKNKATTTGLRLTKEEGNLFYTIDTHAQMRFLCVEKENTNTGRREYMQEMTVLEICRQFPEINEDKDLKRLLYAWEKYTCERWERKELDKVLRAEILKLRQEINKLKEGV